MKKKTLVKIKDGRISFKNKEHIVSFLENNDGAEMLLTLENLFQGRSNSQNKLYWLYLGIISEETGEADTLRLHELFRRMFLFEEIVKVLDKEVRIFKSTTDLDVVEFKEYLEKIELETNVPIPDTDEWKKIKRDSEIFNI